MRSPAHSTTNTAGGGATTRSADQGGRAGCMAAGPPARSARSGGRAARRAAPLFQQFCRGPPLWRAGSQRSGGKLLRTGAAIGLLLLRLLDLLGDVAGLRCRLRRFGVSGGGILDCVIGNRAPIL